MDYAQHIYIRPLSLAGDHAACNFNARRLESIISTNKAEPTKSDDKDSAHNTNNGKKVVRWLTLLK